MSSTADDITLGEALTRIANRKGLVLASLGAGMLAGLIVAWSLRPVYVADVLLAPQTQNTPSLLQQVGQGASALASFAGVNLVGDSGAERDIALATLTSYETISQFVEREGIRERILEEVGSGFSLPFRAKGTPTTWQAVVALRQRVHVNPERGSSLVRISVEWFDPQTASAWANGLVALADARLRERTLTNAHGRLAYLQEALQEANVVSVREAIAGVMESELRSIAIARADKEFSLRVIDAAVPPESPARPRRRVILVAMTFLGLLVGVAAAVALPPRASSARQSSG